MYAEVYENDAEMKEWANFSLENSKAMLMPANVQYVTDQQGKKTAVMIPIREWQAHLKELKTFLEYQAMQKQLTDALLDMKAMKNGQKQKQTLQEFFDNQHNNSTIPQYVL